MIKVTYAGLAALGCGVILGSACLLPLEGAPMSSSSTHGTGGQGGVAAGGGGATGTGGATATTSTGSDGCAPGTKRCGATCVATGDPATGCAGADCAPCGTNHATPTCNAAGACAVMICESGHADCNGDASDGCEIDTTSLSNDAGNCGACQRACASGGITTATCAAGLCTSTCIQGRGNCSQPAAPAADDGCETDLMTTPTSCSACGFACPAGFNCLYGNCGCAFNDANCDAGAPAGTFQCVSIPGADLCKCGNTVCSYGQRCDAGGVCG